MKMRGGERGKSGIGEKRFLKSGEVISKIVCVDSLYVNGEIKYNKPNLEILYAKCICMKGLHLNPKIFTN